ncbi:MAG: T9SS type A sorting domain-containing protein [Bacteroidetes bacterium]|nr:T9SS type A sorting domain-containing protein [Bacteroidota bacterium]
MTTKDVPTMRTDIANYLAQSTTSVSEAQTTERARIYPNPATDVISVDLANNSGTTTIDVVDATACHRVGCD